MNKSVPTLLGIVIILLVVILAVLIVNYQVTKGLGEGKQVVGTVGGEALTGQEAPQEYIPASALGGRAEPEEATQVTPRMRERGEQSRQAAQEKRQAAEESNQPE